MSGVAGLGVDERRARVVLAMLAAAFSSDEYRRAVGFPDP